MVCVDGFVGGAESEPCVVIEGTKELRRRTKVKNGVGRREEQMITIASLYSRMVNSYCSAAAACGQGGLKAARRERLHAGWGTGALSRVESA